jgi:hypothetical protein
MSVLVGQGFSARCSAWGVSAAIDLPKVSIASGAAVTVGVEHSL